MSASDPRPWRDFPPHVLREYSFVADGSRGALIGPAGDIAWLCAPRWDSPAVFSSLIGGRGMYAVTPDEPFVWGGYYETGSLVWRSRWVTPRTTIECREALAYPGDSSCAVLLRRIEAVGEEAVLQVVLDVRADFGRAPMRQLHRADDGTWTATTDDLRLRWRGGGDARVDESGVLRTQLRVPPGRHHDLVLEISDATMPAPEDVDELWRRTENAWQTRAPRLGPTIGTRDAEHACRVLRGMTTPGGGMVAAATLGLPERAQQGSSYDYRYVWLRDQAYAGIAAAVAGEMSLLDAAVSFTTARLHEHGDRLAPAYRVDGGPVPNESRLDLAGYPGGTDVLGNWIGDQVQLDMLGEVLQLLAVAAEHDRLDDDGRAAMELAIARLEATWMSPDAGIWELDDRWWTHSRLSCVAGLRAAAAQSARTRRGHLIDLADAVLDETVRRCLGSDGAWRRAEDVSGPDASLLLPPVRGALPADDPRTRATLAAVEQDLTLDGYVYRFPSSHGRQVTELGEEEGAFVLCGFVMALAKWQQGDQVAAVRWFERNRAACGPPGLFAEEYDIKQRQMRGNLPQAFVHALLLESASRLAHPVG